MRFGDGSNFLGVIYGRSLKETARVHAYKMHEYDAAPKKDARNARHVANDLRRETQAWIQNHAEAKYGNDPRIRKLVNNQREKVEAEYEKLQVTVFELPGEAQVPVQELLAHVEKWLDKCPIFPPELLVEPATGRLSRSVIMTGDGGGGYSYPLPNEDEKDETSSNPESRSYVRGNVIHKFLPPFQKTQRCRSIVARRGKRK